MPNILLESPDIAVRDKGDGAQAYTECVFGYGESLSKTEARYKYIGMEIPQTSFISQ